MRHTRQHDVLYDHRVSADARNDIVGIDAMINAKIANDVGDSIQLHDLAVDDRIARQVFKP